ncbi:MAG: hypothetical protein C0399_07695 [Syntrophus sp. (in: bacteria)]|nr:hypothetical protein [Syntrophus sp. (in: bacteria)]
MTGETRKRRTKTGNCTPKLVHEREEEEVSMTQSQISNLKFQIASPEVKPGGGDTSPGNSKVGEDMTRRRREDRSVKTRCVSLQCILAREGEAPVALLPEGATRAPGTI